MIEPIFFLKLAIGLLAVPIFAPIFAEIIVGLGENKKEVK